MIDNMKRDQSNITGDFIALQTRYIYIGGIAKQTTIYRTIRKNFIGCLKNVNKQKNKILLQRLNLLLLKNEH